MSSVGVELARQLQKASEMKATETNPTMDSQTITQSIKEISDWAAKNAKSKSVTIAAWVRK